jgi:putative transposase
LPTQTRIIQQAYVFAFDATPRQQRAFASHAGAARYAFNWGLATYAEALDAYTAEKQAGTKPETKLPNHFALCKQWTAYKDTHATTPDERGRTTAWVGGNFVGTYQAALRDAATAWGNFFKSRTGQRAGRRMGRPRYKTRHRSRAAFQVHGDTLQVVDAHHIKLPKIGIIKTHESTRKLLRRLKKQAITCPTCLGTGTGEPTSSTITKPATEYVSPSWALPPTTGGEPAPCKACKGKTTVPYARLVRGTVARTSRGTWQISLTAEVARDIRLTPSARQKAGGTLGIDLGVRDLITTSNGERYAAPQHLEHAQRKLRRLAQSLSRTAKDSKRRTKCRTRVARAHGRVASLRLDNTQKLSSTLIHTHQHIVIEGFDLQRLAEKGSTSLPKNVRKRRNRNLADAAPGTLRWQLQSKAVWYGATVTITTAHEATSRTCSACGHVRTKPVPPADEQFTCAGCGQTTDRRINTARLLAQNGRKEQKVAPSGGETLNARGGDVRPGTLTRERRSPVKREARPRRKKPG